MLELININSTSKKSILELCELIIKIKKDFLKTLLGEKKTEYILNFTQPQIIKEEIKTDNMCYLFINLSSQTIGYIKYKINNKTLNLFEFYLLKDFRNQKIGTKIFDKIKNITKNKEIRTIFAFVDIKNKNALKIFEIWGFKKKENIIKYIGSDYYLYSFRMELEL